MRFSAWPRRTPPRPRPRSRLLSPPATPRTARPRGGAQRPARDPCPALGGRFQRLCASWRHVGKQESGQVLPSPALVCFFPSCQLLFGAQIMYSSEFNINGFTLPLSFHASMLRSTENSPVSDQEKSWVISSRGAGGFRGNPCPRGGSADSGTCPRDGWPRPHGRCQDSKP